MRIGTSPFWAPSDTQAWRHGLSSHRTAPPAPCHSGTTTMRPERASVHWIPALVKSRRTLSGKKRTVSLPK